MRILSLILMLFLTLACSGQNDSEDLTPEKLAEIVQEEPYIQLIDVRTADEYSKGTIANAVNIDVLKKDEFLEKIKGLNKEEPVYVFCKSGKRSLKAANILAEQGFETIYNLDGGYKAWHTMEAEEEE